MGDKRIFSIGVLAIQGDFAKHKEALLKSDAENSFDVIFVKNASQLDNLDALIFPGGESSCMLKLLTEEFIEGIIKLHEKGKILFGTCAGAILLAKNVSNPAQKSLGLIDIDIIRNAYGRQVDSFITRDVEVNKTSSYFNLLNTNSEAVFIRAPKISRVGERVEVLISKNESPILVKQNNILLATFHPELSDETHPVYKILLELLH